MKVLFHIFGIPVHFFGVMIAIGVLAGIFAAYKEAQRKGLDIDCLFDIIIYSIIFAVIGARVAFILFYNPLYYLQNPTSVFMINQGGLSIHGGLAGAFVFALIYMKRRNLNFFQYADAIAPGIILGQGIGRIGCDVFGKPVSSPLLWGVVYQGQLLHPAQVYEFLLNYLVFFILWRKRKHIRYDGQIFVWYIILFSINRGIVEIFRINPSISGWFSVSHLLSAVFIFGAAVLAYMIKRKGVDKAADNAQAPGRKNTPLFKDILLLLGLITISLLIYYSVWR